MRDKLYNKELKRDITIAVVAKIILVILLIYGCKYLKKKETSDASPKKTEKIDERYPIFKDDLSINSNA